MTGTTPQDPAPPSVVVNASGEPSGLAEMLQQFIEQTIATSPRKARQARRLNGGAVFRSAEDEDVSVRIRFARNRIELDDGATRATGEPLVSADFLTIAHLTSGRESPFRLLAQRKLKVAFSLSQAPFLLRMMRFLQIDTATSQEQRRLRRLRWIWSGTAAALAAGAVCWYMIAIR